MFTENELRIIRMCINQNINIDKRLSESNKLCKAFYEDLETKEKIVKKIKKLLDKQ